MDSVVTKTWWWGDTSLTRVAASHGRWGASLRLVPGTRACKPESTLDDVAALVKEPEHEPTYRHRNAGGLPRAGSGRKRQMKGQPRCHADIPFGRSDPSTMSLNPTTFRQSCATARQQIC